MKTCPSCHTEITENDARLLPELRCAARFLAEYFFRQ